MHGTAIPHVCLSVTFVNCDSVLRLTCIENNYTTKCQIPLQYLVRSWLQTGPRPASNLSATSFETDSVKESGFYYSGNVTCHNHKPNSLSLGEVPQFSDEREVGCEKSIFQQKIQNISETVQYVAKVTTECGHKLVHSLSIGDIFDDVT